MKSTLPSYIDESIQKRLNAVMRTVTNHLPDDPVEVFVSVGLSQGQSNYPNLWMFTNELAVEIRNPLNRRRIQFDMFAFSNSIDWIRLSARNYDLSDPEDDSQLELEFSTVAGVSSVLLASGEGCCELLQLYKERFLTNFADNSHED